MPRSALQCNDRKGSRAFRHLRSLHCNACRHLGTRLLDFRARKEETRNSLAGLRNPRSPRKPKSWHFPAPVPQCPSWARLTQATGATTRSCRCLRPSLATTLSSLPGDCQHVSVAGVLLECSALEIPSTHSCTARGTWHHPTLYLARLRELGFHALMREPAGLGGETNAETFSHAERAYDEGSARAASSACAP